MGASDDNTHKKGFKTNIDWKPFQQRSLFFLRLLELFHYVTEFFNEAKLCFQYWRSKICFSAFSRGKTENFNEESF